MERVETLIKKLQEQFAAKTPAAQLLITVQMLQAELARLQQNGATQYSYAVTVDIPQTILPPVAAPVTEEKIVQVLQVDEAEIEAELEEIKRNAEAMQKISVQHKPTIIFDDDEHPIPTLAQHIPAAAPEPAAVKKEVNDAVADTGASLNDRLRQSKIDLGDTLTESPVRDLKKAIGINDRFLFINELFRGDENMYERSIKTINSFSILPEAEYWMQRELKVKLGWSDANETVKQFTQLVKRRFT